MDITPLLVIGTGATVLGLSYLAAYLVGREHGRARAERLNQGAGQFDAAQRIGAVEGSLHSLASTVERLRDAQRLLAAQQDHLSRKVSAAESKPPFRQVSSHTNTPA
jgi:hypothetical protein